MRIAVVGSGFTGLTAAYRLSQKGHLVTVFEKEKKAGGLSAGFKKKSWDWSLEDYFHHLFTTDQAAKNLIKELGLADQLFYLRPQTSIFKNNAPARFDSPLTILNFPHLSWPEKVRTGLITAYLKTVSDWQKLEKTTAVKWLQKAYGRRAYRILWEPLLKAKFGPETDQISMAWFWARIKKRSFRLGYFEGGFQILIDRLMTTVKKNKGRFFLNQEIKQLSDLKSKNFDRFLFTVPSSVFLKIAGKRLSASERHNLAQLKMVGALNLILVLKERFLSEGTYWLNINEPGFPFVAVVEHTNFVNRRHYHHQSLLYVGGYYPQNHRYFKMKKESILKEYSPFLKKINPRFNLKGTKCLHISRNLHAQPIVPVNYSKTIPEMKTSIPGVYLANMQMIYPWDRGINYAVSLGERAAHEIQEK